MTADDKGGLAVPLRIREAVRALVVDPDRRVLLVRWDFPDRPELGYPAMSVWGTPGGGMEHGEDVEGALRRELDEELGLVDPVIGPQIWERTYHIPFLDGMWDGQHDQFFLVEVAASFEPEPRLTREQLQAEHLMHVRWWTEDELVTFVPTDTEVFAPRRLPQLLRSLRVDGVPSNPLDVGP